MSRGKPRLLRCYKKPNARKRMMSSSSQSITVSILVAFIVNCRESKLETD
jgi:hypothetical protein